MNSKKAESIRKELEENSGMILLKNFSQESVPTDPISWFLEFSRHIGTPVSQSEKGEFILSIRNLGFEIDDPRTRGPNTNRKLGFHTDRCDVIGFLCLQEAKKGGENQVVKSQEVEAIIRVERPDLHQTLCLPFPYKRHVVDQGNPLPFCMQPVFSWKKNYFACSYLRVLIDRADADPECPKLSAIQKEAINFFDEVCGRKEIQDRFTLSRGDLLFLNNWTTLHRRTSFEDWEEPGRKRHLLRVWLSMPNSRPLDESFRPNFGAVEAGVLRGGMPPSK
ncbi:MAG: hypothetical protein CMI27_04775 [Opitutae bacterium]|nr:hypothetical protein [Opitutae bacterium]